MPLSGPENSLLQTLFLMLLFSHVGIAAFLIGGAGVSLLLQVNGIRGRSLPRRRLAAILFGRSAPGGGFLVLLPILCGLNLLVLEAAYAPGFELPWLNGTIAVLLLCGLLPLLFLHSRLSVAEKADLGAAAIGLGGVLFLLVAYFLFWCELALLLRPEKWPVLSSLPALILSWSAFGEFIGFCCVGLALAGAALICRARGGDLSEGDRRTALRLGIVVTMAALFLLPAGILFDLFNMPSLAFSGAFFASLALVLCLSAGLAWHLAGCWEGIGTRSPALVLGGLLVLLGMLLTEGQIARQNVLTPQTLQRPAGTEPPTRERLSAAGAEKADGEKGEQKKADVSGQAVFERVCSSCHAFDRRVVGPPLNEVLPKYSGDRAALEDFIDNPQKIDPDYPAMPNLGLSPEEIEAVAGYLLERGGG